MGTKHKHLIEQVVDWDNLLAAHHQARRGKRHKNELAYFESNLWQELGAIQMELLWRQYYPGRYRHFVIHEPKRRDIYAPPYRDRVAQHAICNVTGPIWNKSLIDDTYACRPGKGMHRGAYRVRDWLRGMVATGDCWFLKMDISKYFASTPHWLCRQTARQKINCASTLAALDNIVDSTRPLFDTAGIGLPPGNLCSQWWGNINYSPIDQWAKRQIGLRRYIRYMDDSVVIVRTKQEALDLRNLFRARLAQYGFTFSKTSVLPWQRGINFLGYRIWPHKMLLRKDSVKRMRRKMRHMQALYAAGLIDHAYIHQRVASWVAHASYANSALLVRDVAGARVLMRRP